MPLNAFHLSSLWLIIQSSATTAASETEECEPSKQIIQCKVPSPASMLSPDQTTTCSLYMAPSSIEEAGGWGIYAGTDIQKGETINSQFPDAVIPVLDTFKTLPYRGSQNFLAWLGYVWPAEPYAFYPTFTKGSFPPVPKALYMINDGLNAAEKLHFVNENGERVSAFAPGLASLVNTHPNRGENTIQQKKNIGDGGDDSVWFEATTNIQAGSELFLEYGELWWLEYDPNAGAGWEKAMDELVEMAEKELEELDPYYAILSERERRTLVKEDLRRHLTPSREKSENILHVDLNDIHDQYGEGEYSFTNTVSEESRNAMAKVFHDDEDDYENNENSDEDDEGEEELEDKEVSYIKSLDWLNEHGICIDKLTVKESTISGAGRGAFANHGITKGSLISTTPLLALKRDDLNIYKLNEHDDSLDLEHVVGQEELLNYCYGHVDSELLLLPYGPVVNFINHDGQSPNTEIRWSSSTNENSWLELHPLDVMDQSGPTIMMEFVALRDIQPGEEILVDYGQAWEDAWKKHEQSNDDADFFHELGVPDGFYPETWLHKSMKYKLKPLESPLKVGEVMPLLWDHNGKPVSRTGFRVGLPQGLSDHLYDFADSMGMIDLFQQLLYNETLEHGDWFVFDTHGETWVGEQYERDGWKFDIHYFGGWDYQSRETMFRALGRGGFDAVLDGIGKYFGFESISCFFFSLMGLSEAGQSFLHSDVYGTGYKSFNFLFPIQKIDGSPPELDIQSDDANVFLDVNYVYEEAYILGDWGYHRTRTNNYRDTGDMRVMMNLYCSEIDESNVDMIKYINSGEGPTPFFEQFNPPFAKPHWSIHGDRLPK